MGHNYQKSNKGYKKFVKWFGRIMVGIMYILILVHLIIFREPIIFIVGIVVITLFAALWNFIVKIAVK